MQCLRVLLKQELLLWDFVDNDIMLPSDFSNSEIQFNLCDGGFAAATSDSDAHYTSFFT